MLNSCYITTFPGGGGLVESKIKLTQFNFNLNCLFKLSLAISWFEFDFWLEENEIFQKSDLEDIDINNLFWLHKSSSQCNMHKLPTPIGSLKITQPSSVWIWLGWAASWRCADNGGKRDSSIMCRHWSLCHSIACNY